MRHLRECRLKYGSIENTFCRLPEIGRLLNLNLHGFRLKGKLKIKFQRKTISSSIMNPDFVSGI